MIERLTTYIKDFIIYIIPGLIVNFCIIILSNQQVWFINKIENSTNIALLAIIFSFIVGFLITQLQITVFSKIIGRKHLFTLANVIESDNVKSIIKKNVGRLLKIEDVDEIKHTDFRLFCYQYLLHYGTNHIINLIYRSDSLFLFAISIFLPSVLLVMTMLFYFNFSLYALVGVVIVYVIFARWLFKKIIYHFYGDKERKIYHGFLVISSSRIENINL